MYQSVNDLEKDRRRYLVWAKMATFRLRVKKAGELVRQVLASPERSAMSFSSGKDSVVMLDIACKNGFRGDLVFFRYGITTEAETPKENIAMLQRCAKKYGLKYYILDCLGETDCWEMCGRFILQPENETDRKIFHKTNYDFVKKSAQFEIEHSIDLDFIGMRKGESARRKITLSKFGPIYKTKARQSVTCCPLAYFTDDDIWAYIFLNELEYLPIYDYPYIDRRKNRNEITMLYNDAIMEHGMLFHYQQMYPEFFAYLEERWGYRP